MLWWHLFNYLLVVTDCGSTTALPWPITDKKGKCWTSIVSISKLLKLPEIFQYLPSQALCFSSVRQIGKRSVQFCNLCGYCKCNLMNAHHILLFPFFQFQSFQIDFNLFLTVELNGYFPVIYLCIKVSCSRKG